MADGDLVLFDTDTSAFQRHPLPIILGTILGISADSYTVVVGGSLFPGRAVVAFLDLRQGTVRFLDLGSTPDTGAVAYAPKADLLFVGRGGFTGNLEVRRAADNALLKILPIPRFGHSSLSVNALGTRVYVDAGLGKGLLAFDTATGALVAHNPAYPSLAPPILDEHRRRLLVHSPPEFASTPFIAALSSDNLQLIGVTTVPGVPTPPPTPGFSALQVDVSDRSATIFALTTVFRELRDVPDPVCSPSTLVAMNVDTGELRKAVHLTAVTGTSSCYVRLARVTEPAAPSGLSAKVNGDSVSLSWGAEAATHYQVEAGTGPGLANLATVTVDGTQLTVDDVPPGTYHLRVRAINTIGKSNASQEIQVIVP